MAKKETTQIKEITNELVINMIHEVRGQKVMFDFELAELYGYETKALNQQVKNNKDRFPEDFMFQLTSVEVNDILRSKFLTTNKLLRKTRSLPYAFTEEGVYMLTTVLKGDIAIQQSVALMRILKALKVFYQNSTQLSLVNSVNHVVIRTDDIVEMKATLDAHTKQIAALMDNFKDPNKYKHIVLFKDQRIESDIAYQEIYKTATKSIAIVDDYIGIRTLNNLKAVVNKDVHILIISDNVARTPLSDIELNDFIKDTGLNIEITKSDKLSHDRYIVIDYRHENETIYNCGSSSKDSGISLTEIREVEYPCLYHPLLDKYLKD